MTPKSLKLPCQPSSEVLVLFLRVSLLRLPSYPQPTPLTPSVGPSLRIGVWIATPHIKERCAFGKATVQQLRHRRQFSIAKSLGLFLSTNSKPIFFCLLLTARLAPAFLLAKLRGREIGSTHYRRFHSASTSVINSYALPPQSVLEPPFPWNILVLFVALWRTLLGGTRLAAQEVLGATSATAS